MKTSDTLFVFWVFLPMLNQLIDYVSFGEVNRVQNENWSN